MTSTSPDRPPDSDTAGETIEQAIIRERPQVRAVWHRMWPYDRRRVLARLDHRLVEGATGEPWDALRPDQRPPQGDWAVWVLLAGRGFGKTRAGVDWLLGLAAAPPPKRLALVAPSLDAVRSVMVEGESGLLARAPAAAGLSFEPSRRRLAWANGSQALLFSGGEPDSLRGHQFHAAWGDEAAHWPAGEAVLANLRLALRLGPSPQLALTTTPRAKAWLKALMAEPGVETSRGRSQANRSNLPERFIAMMEARYGGTALGRQELDGEIVEDMPGALWTRALIEAARGAPPAEFVRIVLGVDPPAGAGTCGIIVAARDAAGRAWLLADASVDADADGWARAVVAAAGEWDADLVVAECNNGGDMVKSMLKSVSSALPVRPVRASHGKVTRAEPVASLYREGRVRHAAAFPALEEQLCGLLQNGIYAGPGRSPDRADAAVWALWALLLEGPAGTPGVRGF
jgi:phage terminase large subunit-like protein